MTRSIKARNRSLNSLAPAMNVEERTHDDVRRLAKLAPALNRNMAADAARREARKKALLSIPKSKRTVMDEAVLQSMAASEIMAGTGVFGKLTFAARNRAAERVCGRHIGR